MTPHQEELTRLGYYAVAPFIFSAALMWMSPVIIPQWVALNVHTLILAYGGIVAALLAGAGIGAALRSPFSEPLLPALLAALIAWFAIWPSGFLTISVAAVWRYLLLIFLLVFLLNRDLAAAARGDFPAWYGPLRTRLTFWMVVSLILIMARLISWRYY